MGTQYDKWKKFKGIKLNKKIKFYKLFKIKIRIVKEHQPNLKEKPIRGIF
jgi:hypothetical protein